MIVATVLTKLFDPFIRDAPDSFRLAAIVASRFAVSAVCSRRVPGRDASSHQTVLFILCGLRSDITT
jgi:hypothetical protein